MALRSVESGASLLVIPAEEAYSPTPSMDQADVAVIFGAAAVGAAVVIVGFLRSSRTADEGMRKLRLLVNVFLLGFYYAAFGVALALFALGLFRSNTNYWFAAMAFLLVALLLFRDMSAYGRNPLSEWFSGSPLSARARGMKEDTRSLMDELGEADTASSGSASSSRDSGAEGATEPPRDEKTGPRTYTFEFHWPPRKRDS